jgi:glyoxylase-like metal-dependent hydrolase (beta-lactamase superfamily II)
LFETGAGPDYPEVWGAPLNDIFARVDYTKDQELDAQIAKTGHNIKDVKAVIMGHLHIDHAGGLTYFKGTDVPIWVHELELKHAYFSVLTKTDLGTSAWTEVEPRNLADAAVQVHTFRKICTWT